MQCDMRRSDMNSGSGSSTPTFGLSNGMLVMNHSVTPAGDADYRGPPATVELHNRMSPLVTVVMSRVIVMIR